MGMPLSGYWPPTCGHCGTFTSGSGPYLQFPPSCLDRLDGGEVVPPERVGSAVSVRLCADCWTAAEAIIMEARRSPAPALSAFVAGWDVPHDGASTAEDRRWFDRLLVKQGLRVARAVDRGRVRRLQHHQIVREYATLLTADAAGLVDALRRDVPVAAGEPGTLPPLPDPSG
jgi:hypothetical protein